MNSHCCRTILLIGGIGDRMSEWWHRLVDVVTRLADRWSRWVDGLGREDILKWETWALLHVLHPLYWLLGAVHLMIWVAMRIAMHNNPVTPRQRALARFMASKALMWFIFATRSNTDLHDVYSLGALLLAIFIVLVTALDVAVRYVHLYVILPCVHYRRMPRRRIRQAAAPPDEVL